MREKILYTFTHILLPLILGVTVVAMVIAAHQHEAFPSINASQDSLVTLLIIALTMFFLGGVGQIGSNGQ